MMRKMHKYVWLCSKLPIKTPERHNLIPFRATFMVLLESLRIRLSYCNVIRTLSSICDGNFCDSSQLSHDGGAYHTETSPLICRANQWTGFNMIGTSVIRELMTKSYISGNS